MMDRDLFQNKFHLISLGCPRNLVDSEVMIGLMLKAGFECTRMLNDADFIVINTCSFLNASRKEGCDTIQHVFDTKKKCAKVIIAGCMVQQCKEELKKSFPDIHYFVGSGDVDQILQALQIDGSAQTISSAKSFLEWGEIPRTLSTPRHYAYLKIAEGCRKRCAFCIIPAIKGPLRSKSIEQVMKEFKNLLDRGVFEVILIAQDLGDFGKDRNAKGELATLLREMVKEPRKFWLRLLYLYPDEIDDELIQVMKSDPRICPYLDMPIQHINDELLRKMHRKTSRSQIVEIIRKLRTQIPDISIRTSLIVGFPSESEEQFQELVEFVRKQQLDHVGIFSFSPEKEAPASVMDGQISNEEKERRLKILARAQQKVLKKKYRSFFGRRVMAIIDGNHPDSNLLLTARHSGQCPEIDGQIIINDAPGKVVQGQLYLVELTDVAGYDLIGRIMEGQ
jgi:ribosomal protein S12 methylthiotransferase